MGTKVFIDTWAWLCIWDKKEKRHTEISNYYKKVLKENSLIYTTDYVLDETFTLIFRRVPFEKAVEFVNIIQEAKEKRVLYVEKINENRFDASISLRKKFSDKPDISFTDLSSMVVMEELGIMDIITGDEHFIKVGMDFKVVP